MQKLYLYLANRNKNGIQLVTVLRGEKKVLAKIKEVETLKLPLLTERKINKIILDNRMQYELWMESADSFADLTKKLKARGYKSIPTGVKFLLETGNYGKAPVAHTKEFNNRKIMMKKRMN